MDRLLTEKIRAEVLNSGMDLIGFAPVGRWKNAPYLLSPKAILPESQTVIVAGIHITDAWTEMGGEPDPQTMGPGGWMDQNSLLDRIAYRVVRLLNDYGYKATGVASSNIWRYRKMDGLDSWFTPDLSHIHAATAAGLAQIGWHGISITPEFGPRVRFISIVTDAQLVSTPMYNGPDLCDLCMECVKACPSAALKRDFDGDPRKVVIDGKEFKYANKNIWRCAWAEHFNLDLQSETLKKDHIDENDIILEKERYPDKGHERGVCQKVCIPPHLRTDKDSFGREGKKISLSRINRRYPDDMPTLKKMRDDIIAKAVELGVEIVGVSRLDTQSKVGKAVLSQAPGMNTVMGFAFSIPKEAKTRGNYNSYVSNAYSYAISKKMHHILLRIARFIEDYGYYAASYTGMLPTKDINLKEVIINENYESNRYGEKTPLIAYELSEMVGVGIIEEDFKTPEFGEDVIVGAIVTDANLDELKYDLKQGKEYINMPYIPNRMLNKANTLRSVIENIARQNLVSLFGVAPAQIFDSMVPILKENLNEDELGYGVIDENRKPQGKWISKIIKEDVKICSPKDYMNDARSVIVLGMNFPGELIENLGLDTSKQIGTYAYYTYQTIFELRFAALEVANYLNKLGYKTLMTENMLGIGSKVDNPRGLLPDFRCNALEGVAAGLGEIGKNGGLLTPEYGAHQRQIVIITDAELPYNTPYNKEKICLECGNCISKCPMSAYEEKYFTISIGNKKVAYPLINRYRCDWAKKYSLNRDAGHELVGNKTHVELPNEGELNIEKVAEACNLRDEIMKRRSVILEPCIRYCKAGGIKHKR